MVDVQNYDKENNTKTQLTYTTLTNKKTFTQSNYSTIENLVMCLLYHPAAKQMGL